MSRNLERRRIWPVAGMALVLLAAGALVVSCGKKEAGGAGGDKVLAKVDGTEIKQSDADSAKRVLPIQYQSLPDNVLMPVIMSQLIDRRVTSLAAEKAGLDKDPKVKQDIAQSREDVLQSAYLRQEASKAITDAAVRDAYQQQVAAFAPQTEIRARHILMQDEAGIRLAEQRIVDGESFAAVASEMSGDSSAEHGGDLGYFTRDKMVKEFADVAFTLQPGQMSQPFRSQFGWHIVKVEDRRQTQPPTFEQVQGVIRAQMSEQVMRDKAVELRQQAKIERLDPWANAPSAAAEPEPAPSSAPVAEPEPAPETVAPSAIVQPAPVKPAAPAKALGPSPAPAPESGLAPPPAKLPAPAPSPVPQPPASASPQ